MDINKMNPASAKPTQNSRNLETEVELDAADKRKVSKDNDEDNA